MEKENSCASFEDLISDCKGAKQAGLAVLCDLSPEEFKAGFRPLEKQRRRAKNRSMAFGVFSELILMIVIWLVIFLVFWKKFSSEDLHSFLWVSAGFCSPLFFALIISNVPDFFEVKRKFSVEFYNDLVWIERADKVISLIPYESVGGSVTEYNESFIITSSDQNMYIIPKGGLDEEKTKKIRIYAKKFKERYIDKTR